MVGTLVVVGFFGWLAWKADLVVLSALLRVMAWFMVVVIVVNVIAGLDPVPGPMVAVIGGLWLVGHAIFRVRRGYWRSAVLCRLSDINEAHKADRETPPPWLGTPPGTPPPWRWGFSRPGTRLGTEPGTSPGTG
jgi:hypothetical protein